MASGATPWLKRTLPGREGEIFQRGRRRRRSVDAATETRDSGTRPSGKGILAEAEEVVVPGDASDRREKASYRRGRKSQID